MARAIPVGKSTHYEGPKAKEVTNGAASAWLIVRAMAGKERVLMDVAKSEGFDVYRPVIIKSKRGNFGRTVMVVTAPMLPGYVLLKPLNGNGEKVFRLPGAMPGQMGVLDFALYDTVVEDLRSRERNGIIDGVSKMKKPKRATRIRVLGGLIDAVVNEDVDSNRINLVTQLFRGSAKFTCSLDQIIKH